MKSNTSLWSEQGSAIVDLVGFGVLLQIPILMFATFAVSTQAQSLAVESIARHALRSHSLLPDLENTKELISSLAKDFGVSESRLSWSLWCVPNPNCLEAVTTARIEVRYGGLVASTSTRF